MKTLTIAVGFILLALTTSQCTESKQTMSIKENAMHVPAPEPKKKDTLLSAHGDERLDHYYWMNQREDQDVIDHLNAENSYLDTVMTHTKTFQKDLFEEIVSRIPQDDASAPYFNNGYFYYVKYKEGQEHPIYMRKKGSLDAKEEVLLDVNIPAVKYSYYQVTGLSVSPDNKWLAYGVDTLSRRIYTIHFKNIETGEVKKEKIANTTGRAVWANDNQTVFYSQKDATLRPYRVLKYKLGATMDPEIVFEETDSTYVSYVSKSQSKEYIFIVSSSTLTSEYRYIPAGTPDQSPTIFHQRERGIEYDVDHLDSTFYILTNWKAENFRIMTCDKTATPKENWKEKIAHRKDVLIQDFSLFDRGLVVSERVEGISKIRCYGWKKEPFYIKFDETAYTSYIGINKDSKSNTIRLQYTSMTTPMSVIDYHVDEDRLEVIKEQEVLGNFSKENYSTERIQVKGRDGSLIPISIVYRKELKKEGPQPTLLYGYGSYGYSMDPYFSHVRLSLLDRGVVFAIAHIRGGQEMGRQWYEDGKLLHKKNTFKDFIDVADYLVSANRTTSNQLLAMGGSAGGLLIGSVINMRPNLFKAVVAAVPFVDVVTTMMDESIPLTTGEYDEWGNPNNEEYYHYIKSYSPYDNVVKQDYPAVLATTGLHDSQVQYWEPAKWVARLRDNNTSDAPILLYTNMDTGHGGASGRFERYKDTAMEYAFLLDMVGLMK
jgi:oligopeptidase B